MVHRSPHWHANQQRRFVADRVASRLQNKRPLCMGVVLFPGWELLDVCAPAELLGAKADDFKLVYAAQQPGLVRSSCLELSGGSVGPSVNATHRMVEGGLLECEQGSSIRPDALLVPGGIGVRDEVHNEFLMQWLRDASHSADIVFTVCTGSWLLGATGVLDGLKVTSNKASLRKGLPQKLRRKLFGICVHVGSRMRSSERMVGAPWL